MGSKTICSECSATGGTASETFQFNWSPVHNLLQNNLPPPRRFQVKSACQTIHEIQRDLAEVEEAITHMRSVFKRLLSKRMALQDYLAAHKGLISPLRRLPAETIGEIFIHALPHLPFELDGSPPPLLFQLVCRRWKEVACSTPALWACVSLNLQKHFTNHDIAVATACLARSGQLPLTVSLGSRGYHPMAAAGVHTALRLLMAHCERWRTVHMMYVPLDVLEQLEEVRGRLSLKRLYLVTGGDEDSQFPIKAFSIAPELRKFVSSSGNYSDMVTSRALHLPWNTLTSLEIDKRRAREIWPILLDCSSLVDLQVMIDSGSDMTNVPPVYFPCLRTLSLTLPESSTLLSKFIAPVLQEAHFTVSGKSWQDEDRTDPWHMHSGLNALLMRAKHTLNKLALQVAEECCFGPQDIVPCLSFLPSSTALAFSDNINTMLLLHAGSKIPPAPYSN
ncbi:hypothetical protein HWV62_25282 [Athelia sp. TMB]|nr:hypothetical protein HWV62_25282 [Athelia sp. TMB]